MNAKPHPQTIFECKISSQPGALERVMRVVRVRGFQVEDLRLQRLPDGYEAQLTVSGSRPPETLLRQLQKLLDVKGLKALNQPTQTSTPELACA
ncbi:Acetolactate synthase (isozyme II), small (regulatory) subunit [Hahella chejuensis KCTC 2396]|uniref:Acetolactate synthase (Isozyme II), small (Regulatory) subunit n=1 Tax=Hahella chejuensis (strain KCTC 2396) TaxID=349521 RepID=Q2S797_HAHCH|nr:ACT domain-containing protein [Hahella chejuensis]ABC33477.1 Acetolactate synthase (isozyme II), small (regulatory) subunit [Hahella chejuensis KCTC 2396]